MHIFSYIELYCCLLCHRTGCYCMETCTIDNLTIPKGCHIVIPIHVIHTSSEYWDQPELFKPERYFLVCSGNSHIVVIYQLKYTIKIFP